MFYRCVNRDLEPVKLTKELQDRETLKRSRSQRFKEKNYCFEKVQGMFRLT